LSLAELSSQVFSSVAGVLVAVIRVALMIVNLIAVVLIVFGLILYAVKGGSPDREYLGFRLITLGITILGITMLLPLFL